MAEAAVATVRIIPVSPGATRQIEKELGGEQVGQNVGKKIGGGIANAVGKIAKTALVATGAVAVAGLGAALVKGFNRLNAIDTAQAKLRGLGNSAADVDVIMQNALASVRGTAFGLGDAATVAAQAVAAGIKPGQQLEGVLKSVANSAAAAGTDLNDMGSIYAKVASLGKAQNDVLQQVADRGIPIYQALGNQLGVTADEVFKLASQGKIGFEQFEAAMTAASGTVASEIGGTLTGSLDNFGAALGRVGAGILGGAFPLLAPAIQRVTAALGPFETSAAALGAVIGEKLQPFIESLVSGIERISAGFATGGIDGAVLALGQLSPIFAFIAPLASSLASVVPVLAKALGEVGRELVSSGAIEALAKVAIELLPVLAQVLIAVIPLLPVLAKVVSAVLVPALELLAGALGDNFTAFGALFGLLSGTTSPQQFAQKISSLNGPIGLVTRAIRDMTVGFISAGRDAGRAIASFANDVRTNIGNAIGFIAALPGRAASALGNLGGTLYSSGRDLIQGFINGIRDMVRNVSRAVGDVMATVRGFFPNSPAKYGPFSGSGWTALQQSGKALFDQFASGAQGSVSLGVDYDSGMPPTSSRYFGSLAPDAPNGRATYGMFAGANLLVRDEVLLLDEVEKRERRAQALEGLDVPLVMA